MIDKKERETEREREREKKKTTENKKTFTVDCVFTGRAVTFVRFHNLYESNQKDIHDM